MPVGFIGVGTMGTGMVGNLRKGGHELVLHDVRREAAEPHLGDGCTWADSPREVAEECEVVFTSLPGPPEVEGVATDEIDGLIAGMKPGTVWFDLSTNSPTMVRKLHGVMAEKGVSMLDAPVSGGQMGAANGTLAIWVGGDEALFEKYKHLLEAMGDQPKYIGPIGAGSVAKLTHNVSVYMVQTALAEAFTMGVKAGVDPLPLWDAIRYGALGRRRTFDSLQGLMLGQFEPASFKLALAHKDVTLATQLGRDMGVPMRMANMALAELTEAMGRGWAERDSRVAVLLQEERAGLDPIKIAQADIEAVRDKG